MSYKKHYSVTINQNAKFLKQQGKYLPNHNYQDNKTLTLKKFIIHFT